jgi:hypothetical protein
MTEPTNNLRGSAALEPTYHCVIVSAKQPSEKVGQTLVCRRGRLAQHKIVWNDFEQALLGP